MFTGLIQDVGKVKSIEQFGDQRFHIATQMDVNKIAIGDSIACSGVCLTVVGKEQNILIFDVSGETLSKTTLGAWKPGQAVNLEKSLRVGDFLGGHMVYGHVDATTDIINIKPDGDSLRFSFAIPPGFERFIAPKGSIALDGISLTINEVTEKAFGVNIIPHTHTHTSWQFAKAWDKVNVEIDIVARYVARMAECKAGEKNG